MLLDLRAAAAPGVLYPRPIDVERSAHDISIGICRSGATAPNRWQRTSMRHGSLQWRPSSERTVHPSRKRVGIDRRRIEGTLFFVAFMASIPIANWMIGNIGTQCVPDGPCLIPVAPTIMAPSGVLMIGAALVLRDMVQRRLGKSWSLVAIAAGTLLSAAIASPALVVASASAFLMSELADFAVYTPLQRRRLVLAVFLSGIIGSAVDSIVFLYLAFGSLQFLAGQIIGKLLMVMAALPVIALLRWRDNRVGLSPA